MSTIGGGVYDEEGVVPLEADAVATGAISSSLFAFVGEEEDVHGSLLEWFRHVFPPLHHHLLFCSLLPLVLLAFSQGQTGDVR